MNAHRKFRWGKDRANNLIVGGGATLFFVALVGYGLWTRPVGATVSSETTVTKGKESVMEITIGKNNFEAEVLKSARPVLVDFWAPWCGPCRMLAPVLAEVARTQGDRIKVGKVNVDEELELAAKYGISSIPAMLLFRDGKVIATSIGFKSKPELEAFIQAHVP